MINEGEKFGLVCLSRAEVHYELPSIMELPNDYIASTDLPEKLDSHWREWLGTSRCEQLESAVLYFGCTKKSKTPDILDQENKDLEYRTLCFYWSLFISGFVRSFDSPMHFTGTMLESGLNVRSVGSMVRPHWVSGTPLRGSRIDTERLNRSAKLAKSIFELYEDKRYGRFKRIIGAFTSGIHSHHADVRLHQFIRCVEGFILPDIGNTKRQFKSRTELFVGPALHSAMDELYELRSRAEHVHDALEYFDVESKNEKLRLLFHRAFDAEGLARYCIARFLERRELWPYFESDSALASFWALDSEVRRDLWSEVLDFSDLSNQFEGSRISDHELGEE